MEIQLHLSLKSAVWPLAEQQIFRLLMHKTAKCYLVVLLICGFLNFQFLRVLGMQLTQMNLLFDHLRRTR